LQRNEYIAKSAVAAVDAKQSSLGLQFEKFLHRAAVYFYYEMKSGFVMSSTGRLIRLTGATTTVGTGPASAHPPPPTALYDRAGRRAVVFGA